MQYCSDLPGEFYNDSCPDEGGGIIAVGFIQSDTYDAWTDFEDPTEWAAAIAAGTVKPITDTKGSYPGIEPVTKTGYGRTPTVVTGGNHVITYMHQNVNEKVGGVAVNIDFYNKIKDAAGIYYFYAITGDLHLRVWDKACVVIPKDEIPEDLNDNQQWNVEIQISSRNLAASYDATSLTDLYV